MEKREGGVMITSTTTTVWHSSIKRRRYLSQRAAVEAEVSALIYQLYPPENPEFDNVGMTYPGYDIKHDEPERYAKLHRRIKRLVERAMERGNA